MPYLIFATDGQEWDRRELTADVVLGRSADCEICIHDILLSRRHCRFAPTQQGWLVTDLASRNGTIVGDQAIEERLLKSGDVLRVGKTRVSFRAEAFVPENAGPKRPSVPPALTRMDDTLAGTIVGMEFDLRPVPVLPPALSRRPTPRPRPKDPESFETDGLYSMLEQITSNSWDSVYAMSVQPVRKNRTMPQPIIAGQPWPRVSTPPINLVPQAETPQAATLERQMMATSLAPGTRRRIAKLGRWIVRVGAMRLF